MMMIVASHRDAHAGSSGGFHCTLGAASFDKQLHSHCVIFPIIITGKVALHISDPEASADSDDLNLPRYLSFSYLMADIWHTSEVNYQIYPKTQFLAFFSLFGQLKALWVILIQFY